MENKQIENLIEEARKRAKVLWCKLYEYFYSDDNNKDIVTFLQMYRDYTYLKDNLEMIDLAEYRLKDEFAK